MGWKTNLIKLSDNLIYAEVNLPYEAWKPVIEELEKDGFKVITCFGGWN